jgi:hypothetical protein
MKTIYIKGIKKYKVSIIKGLNKSSLIDGLDYIQGLAGEDYALYWLRENLELREFKLAIGAKFVFKHRMRFFNTIEEMNPPKRDDGLWSESEINLMDRIKKKYSHV